MDNEKLQDIDEVKEDEIVEETPNTIDHPVDDITSSEENNAEETSDVPPAENTEEIPPTGEGGDGKMSAEAAAGLGQMIGAVAESAQKQQEASDNMNKVFETQKQIFSNMDSDINNLKESLSFAREEASAIKDSLTATKIYIQLLTKMTVAVDITFVIGFIILIALIFMTK